MVTLTHHFSAYLQLNKHYSNNNTVANQKQWGPKLIPQKEPWWSINICCNRRGQSFQIKMNFFVNSLQSLLFRWNKWAGSRGFLDLWHKHFDRMDRDIFCIIFQGHCAAFMKVLMDFQSVVTAVFGDCHSEDELTQWYLTWGSKGLGVIQTSAISFFPSSWLNVSFQTEWKPLCKIV